jgi:hypothetical protein
MLPPLSTPAVRAANGAREPEELKAPEPYDA